MGQSARATNALARRDVPDPTLSIFPTNLGWFGLLGRGSRLLSVLIGHVSADEVRRAAARLAGQSHFSSDIRETDWNPQLRRRLERYCLGEREDFDDVVLELPSRTKFQQQVLKLVRRIPYGKTMSYGRIAGRAGYPRAARAVGTVMSSNRFPIVVPCHRVVAAGEKIGGYTSPQGISLKERLLELERGQ